MNFNLQSSESIVMCNVTLGYLLVRLLQNDGDNGTSLDNPANPHCLLNIRDVFS